MACVDSFKQSPLLSALVDLRVLIAHISGLVLAIQRTERLSLLISVSDANLSAKIMSRTSTKRVSDYAVPSYITNISKICLIQTRLFDKYRICLTPATFIVHCWRS